MRDPRLLALVVLLAAAAALVASVGCVGYQDVLMPNRLRLDPGLTTAGPGEVTNFKLKAFSWVGIELPMVSEVAQWELFIEPLPEGMGQLSGVRDEEYAGIISLNGQFEASPVVQPGHYRTGRIKATTTNTLNKLSATVYVIVDGDIDPDSPKVEVWPKDLRIPVGTSVPYVTLSIEPRSGRVAQAQTETWSVLSGSGQLSAESGVFAATGDLTAQDAAELEVGVLSDGGRRASAYATLDTEPAGAVHELHLVPEGTLKVALGRTQRFLPYGTDSEGRYVPIKGAEWLIEGGIGRVTENDDGTIEFLAQAAGAGTITVGKGNKVLRRDIIAVIPGA